MDVRQCHDGDALDGDQHLARVPDALHIAFGTLVEAFRHEDAVAGAEFFGVAAQVQGVRVGSRQRRGDPEDVHLAVGNAAGLAPVGRGRIRVVEHLAFMTVLVGQQLMLGTVDEQQRSDHLRQVGVVSGLAEVFLHLRGLAVEDLQGVPGRGFGGLGCRHGYFFVKGYTFHSPTLGSGRKAGSLHENRAIHRVRFRALSKSHSRP